MLELVLTYSLSYSNIYVSSFVCISKYVGFLFIDELHCHLLTRTIDFMNQAGGFDKLLLDSLYEDDAARRHIQLQNAGYGYGATATHNPFEQQQQLQHDPFIMSNQIAPPTDVQMAIIQQQHQQMLMQQQQMMTMMQQPYQHHNMMMVPHQHQDQHHNPQQQMQPTSSSFNPFAEDPFSFPQGQSTMPQMRNHGLL